MASEIRSMKWWGWGDEDTEFDISNRPDLWPYIRTSLDLPEKVTLFRPADFESISMPAQKVNSEFLREIRDRLGSGRVKDDKKERLTHAFGKSFRDLWRMRRGAVNYAPDCVVYPETAEEVGFIVESAVRHQVGIVPFGGGTNIAGCLEPLETQSRMTVSVDMRRMNRLLELDTESETARFQAGVLGPDLEAQLGRSGFTLGHFPDSFRYSTLGGWVATRSAGMQSDRYGKIEDIVIFSQNGDAVRLDRDTEGSARIERNRREPSLYRQRRGAGDHHGSRRECASHAGAKGNPRLPVSRF